MRIMPFNCHRRWYFSCLSEAQNSNSSPTHVFRSLSRPSTNTEKGNQANLFSRQRQSQKVYCKSTWSTRRRCWYHEVARHIIERGISLLVEVKMILNGLEDTWSLKNVHNQLFTNQTFNFVADAVACGRRRLGNSHPMQHSPSLLHFRSISEPIRQISATSAGNFLLRQHFTTRHTYGNSTTSTILERRSL